MMKASVLLAMLSLTACATSHKVMRVGDQKVVRLTVEYANAYLLPAPDGKLLLIDSGFPDDAEKLEAMIRKVGYSPANVATLIVTHAHYDHAGTARFFQAKYGTKIVAGRLDQTMYETGKHDPLCPTDSIARHRLQEAQAGTFRPVSADVWIDSDTALAPIAGIEGTIYNVPSHTRGSLVVAIAGADFVGDLFRGSITGGGAERHFYMCDLEENRRQILHLLDGLTPHAQTYFPGHFGPVKADAVREKFAQ
jgi:hydroxyacylglutathione hydrolase